MKDKLFLTPSSPQSFAFDAKVAAVFDDMISRSVPGYAKIQDLSAEIAVNALTNNQHIYDLGCSTGTSLIKIAQKVKEKRSFDPDFAKNLKLIGVDSSADMIERARAKIAAFELEQLVQVMHADIREVTLEKCALVICHYTLQFLAPNDRSALIKSIFNSLSHAGYFICSEKVLHESALVQNIISEHYDNFKLQNGYSELEIIRKRQALENVLVPLTLQQNIALMQGAGFTALEVLQKDLAFVSFLAQK